VKSIVIFLGSDSVLRRRCINPKDFEERQKSKCWPNEIHILSLFNSPFTVLARPNWAVSQDGYFLERLMSIIPQCNALLVYKFLQSYFCDLGESMCLQIFSIILKVFIENFFRIISSIIDEHFSVSFVKG
jgi:hypothetical protein